jgi:hypothetical protein
MRTLRRQAHRPHQLIEIDDGTDQNRKATRIRRPFPFDGFDDGIVDCSTLGGRVPFYRLIDPVFENCHAVLEYLKPGEPFYRIACLPPVSRFIDGAVLILSFLGEAFHGAG